VAVARGGKTNLHSIMKSRFIALLIAIAFAPLGLEAQAAPTQDSTHHRPAHHVRHAHNPHGKQAKLSRKASNPAANKAHGRAAQKPAKPA
jgi:hypothetical protein